VLPITLRAVVSQLLKDREKAEASTCATLQEPAAVPSPAIPPQPRPPCDLQPSTP
jgi:hypothetical protein